MKRIVTSVAIALVLASGTVALAQTGPRPPAESSHQHGQMGQGMMCPMMGSSMGGSGMGQGMMGMGPGMMGAMMGGSDPKAQARMLKLRGDMMKAMGEVMLKHAQELEQQK